MAQDRDPAVIHDILNKLPAAPRDDQVDQCVFLQHGTDVFPGFQKLGSIRREAFFFQCGLHTGAEDLVCEDCLAPAFQEYGIAAFDTERSNLNQSIRAAFKNDPDDSDGTNNPIQV